MLCSDMDLQTSDLKWS